MTAVAGVNEPGPRPVGDAGMLLDRADLLYCLARAFAPPPPGWSVCDWAQPLSDDLAEIGTTLDVDVAPLQAALAEECGRWARAAQQADADSWLVEYTRLFLMPPVLVPLNTGLYLEGAVGGAAAQMIRSCYETAGTVPDEAFHDLPDHAVMQIEFVARLVERAARGDADGLAMAEEFSQQFIHAWAGPLHQACRQAALTQPAARVYAELAQLLRAVVRDPDLGS